MKIPLRQKNKKFSRQLKTIICGTALLTGLSLFAPCLPVNTGNTQNPGIVKTAKAASSTEDPTGLGASYTAILYDSSSGLPTSEANTAIQTSDGFIWIGSYSGLIRYDGNSFYRYDSSDGISNVISLFEDSKKRLWIGTNDSGVAKYENGKVTFFGKIEGLKSSSIRSIMEDTDGNILIATTLGMAYIDKKQKLHILHDPQLDSEYICELRRGEDGIIYGETISGAFFSLEEKRVKAFFSGNDLGFGVISCIHPDPEHPGFVYLGTEKSEVIYGDMGSGMTNYQVYSVAPQININAIVPSGNAIWVCADNGIGYLDKSFHYTELKNIPMNNSVDGMITDFEGDLWFVSSRQGIMKVAPSQFTDLSLAAHLESKVVNTTCLYDNMLYAGTDTGLILLDKNNRSVKNSLTELLGENRIRCIKTDSKGNLWLCTYSDLGLVCYHKDGSYETFTEKDGLSSNRVRTVAELSDGKMIVSCSGGIFLIENEKITGHYDSSNGISNTEILCIEEGENGVLYLGSDGDGLYKIDGNSSSRFGLEDHLASEVILRIKKDTERNLYWIITSNSLAYMKDEKITTISHFPYPNNFDIFFDEHGGAWVLSSNGIYVMSADTLLKNPKNPEYTFYDTKCGLPCIATANSRSAIEENGNLYIAGTTGISMININEADESDTEIKLTVPFIQVDGELKSVKAGKSITIPADCKRLDIFGYALTYALKNPRVSYYLEGFDDKAVTMSKQDLGEVSYTNLSGGKYKFHLSIINTLTGKEENSISVTIIKKRAFYEYPGFWLVTGIIVVAIVALLIFLYFHKKTVALMKKQEEKQQYIDEVTQAFAKCIDLKDNYTRGHSFRVAAYSRMLAEKMGYSDTEIKEVYNIALMHDIGKLSVPDEILGKPGAPTDEEYEILKQHAKKGYEILKDITIAPNLAIGAGYHHERLDGKGYPNGVTEKDIPLVAQIIAVADTFDAMYSTRPYRKQMPLDVVITELKRVSGTQLNGEIVNYLGELVAEGRVGKKAEIPGAPASPAE